jgi:hypothetical protein
MSAAELDLGLRQIPVYFGCLLINKGKNCKFCNSNWPQRHQVINGIYSDWFVVKII